MLGRDGGTQIDVVRFAGDLARHGDAPAVVDEHGRTCTYAELAERADEVTGRLGARRRLVLVEAANDLDTIAGLLGAYRAGHVVLLTGPDADRDAEIVQTYDPDVLLGGGQLLERRRGTAHQLHPELRLLLSTSGSTGSPKLVRLSTGAIESNARSIAQYLRLRPDDRSITTLPLQYCYGLSVLHSHLVVGASLVCTSASVVDPCFWDAIDRHRVTNLAGVPHTFDLLDRDGFADRSHPTLRFLTQAGGRMAPETVRRWAQVGQRQGFDLYVMYGQTEATARMAYLPPDLVEAHPDAVGVPVPGGSFRTEPVPDAGPDEGELVYAGPNVMLGYATDRSDLALGRTIDELRTGDLARIGPDGLVRVVGRRREILKVFGLRIDLARVRSLLEERELDVTCAGDDEGIAVAVHGPASAVAVREIVSSHTGLPAGAVAVAHLAEPPRLRNGKVDGPALVAEVRRSELAGAAHDEIAGPISRTLASLLGAAGGEGDTFVSLGGDSLTYVEASIALEHRLGQLPPAWHLTPLGELDRLERAAAGRRRPALARVDTGVVLRAIAIVLVVANHTRTFHVGGGAHLLFAAAGFNMARFQLRSGSWNRSIARIAVPAVAWIGTTAAVTEDFDLAHALLLHGWVGGRGRWSYWFVEVLVQVLVVTAVAMGIPAVRRFEGRRPFALPMLLLAPALAVRFDLVELGEHHRPFFRPHEIAWLFLLGWATASARTGGRRVAVTVVALGAVPGFFGNGVREAVVLTGLLLLLWVPVLPLPRAASPVVATVAGASLHVYLTHVQVHPLVSNRSPVAGLVLSLVVGIGVWRATLPLQRWLELRFRARPHRRCGAETHGEAADGG